MGDGVPVVLTATKVLLRLGDTPFEATTWKKYLVPTSRPATVGREKKGAVLGDGRVMGRVTAFGSETGGEVRA